MKRLFSLFVISCSMISFGHRCPDCGGDGLLYEECPNGCQWYVTYVCGMEGGHWGYKCDNDKAVWRGKCGIYGCHVVPGNMFFPDMPCMKCHGMGVVMCVPMFGTYGICGRHRNESGGRNGEWGYVTFGGKCLRCGGYGVIR